MNQKPPALIEMAPKVVPALILLFDGLKRAYAAKAQSEAEEEESESDEADLGEGILCSNLQDRFLNRRLVQKSA